MFFFDYAIMWGEIIKNPVTLVDDRIGIQI